MTEKTKLSGGPDKTATWIWLEVGQLKVEFYDFSETAQQMFGNDIAYMITVHDMNGLFSVTKQDRTSIISWTAAKFQSYFGIKKWLEKNEFGFDKEIDSWA
jgi:hypothetical protein